MRLRSLPAARQRRLTDPQRYSDVRTAPLPFAGRLLGQTRRESGAVLPSAGQFAVQTEPARFPREPRHCRGSRRGRIIWHIAHRSPSDAAPAPASDRRSAVPEVRSAQRPSACSRMPPPKSPRQHTRLCPPAHRPLPDPPVCHPQRAERSSPLVLRRLRSVPPSGGSPVPANRGIPTQGCSVRRSPTEVPIRLSPQPVLKGERRVSVLCRRR